MLIQILDLFKEQDSLIYIILSVTSVAWVIALERALVLQFIFKISFKKFNPSLRKMLAAGDFDRARAFCKSYSQRGLPLIALKAIDAYEHENFRVKSVIEEETKRFLPMIRKRIHQIPVLAGVSVLLGASATLNSVWNAFQISDAMDAGIRGFVFSKGLNSSLSPLAFSLFACASLVLAYGFLEAISVRLEEEVDLGVTMISNVLAPEVVSFAGVQALPQVQPSSRPASVMPVVEEEKPEPSAEIVNEDISSGKPPSIEKVEAVPDEEEII
jgi:hypothetical protein